MSATITDAHRKIIYEPGINNAWVQLHKFWVGYVYAICGAPPEHITMDMDENGVLTLTPDFEHEGKEIANKRKAAIIEGHNGPAEAWLRAHKLWGTDIVKCKQGRGRPSTRHKIAVKEGYNANAKQKV